MAVPPTVPTSFVPRAPASFRPGNFDFGGALAFVGYGAFVIAVFMAGLVFGYEWYLTNAKEGNSEKLQQALTDIDMPAVDSFTRLHNRLGEGKRVLNQHVILSRMFEPVETLLPTRVRLSKLTVSIDANTGHSLTAEGEAASLNALAALSTKLGEWTDLKDAVFSNIKVEKGEVAFTLSAKLDPAAIAFTVESVSGIEPYVPEGETTGGTQDETL